MEVTLVKWGRLGREGDGWHGCGHQVATCATGPQGAVGARCDFGPGKGIGEGVGMTLLAAPASISSALPSLPPHYSGLCFQVVPCALFHFFFVGAGSRLSFSWAAAALWRCGTGGWCQHRAGWRAPASS